jgi:hypothetical protein
MLLCTIRLYELTSTFSRPMPLLLGETAHFFLLSGSSKMPSFSSRLLASSRAQVCILQEKSQVSLVIPFFLPDPHLQLHLQLCRPLLPAPKYLARDTQPHRTVPRELEQEKETEKEKGKRGTTHEVSGLKQ